MIETTAPPLREPESARTRTAAEAARAIVAARSAATLATLTVDGGPWASLVTYGQLADGSPVLLVSVTRPARAQPAARRAREPLVADDAGGGDPLDAGRVTLAGRAEVPAGTERTRRAARSSPPPRRRAHTSTSTTSRSWRCGWSACAGSAGTAAWAPSTPATTAPPSRIPSPAPPHPRCVTSTRTTRTRSSPWRSAPAGFTDATSAVCQGADRYGLDLWVTTPRGSAPARVGFAAPCTRRDGLRAATVELARRSQAMG